MAQNGSGDRVVVDNGFESIDDAYDHEHKLSQKGSLGQSCWRVKWTSASAIHHVVGQEKA